MEESHKQYAAFATRRGLFEFNRMPFGLCGAPFTFQKVMNKILSKENWIKCVIYLDDVLVFGKTFDELLENLNVVLVKLENSGIKAFS